MSRPKPVPAHLVTGGFPPGAPAAHDIDYARRRLLGLLGEFENARTTVSSDLADIERWLERSRFVVTYTSGPHLDEAQSRAMQDWLEAGGRWLGLHGSSGGRAAPVDGDRSVRRMVKTSHHAVLGAFFLNHPPVRRFRVDVKRDHPLARGLPASFETVDELYLIELQDPEHTDLLLTTDLDKDPSPPGFG
ncbi:MAG: ThuA domain-containing protein, partial [Deltaproteobacteria bacterium]|nr:ThuA domain-containing protein [Deltaproteobacteria bacterium]